MVLPRLDKIFKIQLVVFPFHSYHQEKNIWQDKHFLLICKYFKNIWKGNFKSRKVLQQAEWINTTKLRGYIVSSDTSLAFSMRKSETIEETSQYSITSNDENNKNTCYGLLSEVR